MNDVGKRQVLERRVGLLREHIETVGSSPGFTRELQKAEAELAQLGQQEQQPPQGP